MSRINNRQILCDFWYFQELDDLLCPFEKYAEEKLGPRLARFLLRISVLRALLLIWLGREFSLIAPDWYRYGRLICFLQAILGNRNIVIFECIDIDVRSKGPIVAAAILFIYKYVVGPIMRASVVAVQVMTNREQQIFVERYGLPEDVLHTVPWPLLGMDYSVKSAEWLFGIGNSIPGRLTGTARHHQFGGDEDGYVLASGYISCDWKTLFEAAHFGNWPLIVVCSSKGTFRALPLSTRTGVQQCSAKSMSPNMNGFLLAPRSMPFALKKI